MSALIAVLLFVLLRFADAIPQPPTPSGTVAWAGDYSYGNGYWGATLTLEKAGSYKLIEWSDGIRGDDPIGERLKSYGVYRVEDGRILLEPTDSDRPKRRLKAPLALLPIRWGPRLYLLKEKQLTTFRDAIQQGEEPRLTQWSAAFLLRKGDDKKRAPGLPDYPTSGLRLLRGVVPVTGPIKPGWEYLSRVQEAMQEARLKRDWASAARFARDLLLRYTDEKTQVGYGETVDEANQTLGLAALASGDVAKAKEFLLAAGRAPGGPALDTYGPDMTLAENLLAHGQRDVVLQYLDLVGRFWKEPKRLNAWKASIRAGKTPRLHHREPAKEDR